MEEKRQRARVMIGALLFGMFVLFVFIFTFYRSLASNVSVEIGNTAPTVVSAHLHTLSFTFTDAFGLNDPVNVMIPGSTGSLYGNGRVEDTNGRDDITNVRGVFYRSSVAEGAACVADNNDCYVVPSCTLRAMTGNELRKEYSCHFLLSSYIDATSSDGRYPSDTWRFYAEVSDGSATASSTVSTEVSALLSLDIPSSINYGNMTLGEKTTPGAVKITVAQQGNIRAGLQISSEETGMVCSGRGSIPRENQEYATTAFTHGAGTDLSGTPASTGMVVDWQESGTAISDDLYLGIEVPSGGVEGTCHMTDTLTAMAL